MTRTDAAYTYILTEFRIQSSEDWSPRMTSLYLNGACANQRVESLTARVQYIMAPFYILQHIAPPCLTIHVSATEVELGYSHRKYLLPWRSNTVVDGK